MKVLNTINLKLKKMEIVNNNSIEEIKIREVLEDYWEGIRTKDADRAMSHFTSDLVEFLLAPPLKYGGKNKMDKKGTEDWFNSFEGNIGYDVHDLKIAASESIAWYYSLIHLSGVQKPQKTDLWFRFTAGLMKINGEWKIAHQHESVPFYMDGSNKAATDLKPE